MSGGLVHDLQDVARVAAHAPLDLQPLALADQPRQADRAVAERHLAHVAGPQGQVEPVAQQQAGSRRGLEFRHGLVDQNLAVPEGEGQAHPALRQGPMRGQAALGNADIVGRVAHGPVEHMPLDPSSRAIVQPIRPDGDQLRGRYRAVEPALERDAPGLVLHRPRQHAGGRQGPARQNKLGRVDLHPPGGRDVAAPQAQGVHRLRLNSLRQRHAPAHGRQSGLHARGPGLAFGDDPRLAAHVYLGTSPVGAGGLDQHPPTGRIIGRAQGAGGEPLQTLVGAHEALADGQIDISRAHAMAPAPAQEPMAADRGVQPRQPTRHARRREYPRGIEVRDRRPQHRALQPFRAPRGGCQGRIARRHVDDGVEPTPLLAEPHDPDISAPVSRSARLLQRHLAAGKLHLAQKAQGPRQLGPAGEVVHNSPETARRPGRAGGVVAQGVLALRGDADRREEVRRRQPPRPRPEQPQRSERQARLGFTRAQHGPALPVLQLHVGEPQPQRAGAVEPDQARVADAGVAALHRGRQPSLDPGAQSVHGDGSLSQAPRHPGHEQDQHAYRHDRAGGRQPSARRPQQPATLDRRVTGLCPWRRASP